LIVQKGDGEWPKKIGPRTNKVEQSEAAQLVANYLISSTNNFQVWLFGCFAPRAIVWDELPGAYKRSFASMEQLSCLLTYACRTLG
jgi:hypothetical protein